VPALQGCGVLLFRLIFGREPTRHFTVFEPPVAASGVGVDRVDQAERLVFIRDGFAWTAWLFTPLWLLAKRAWLALLVYVVAAVALVLLARVLGLSGGASLLVLLAAQMIFGFEAEGLERWLLERDGWRMVGSVNGRSIEECERRFFDAWLPSQMMRAPAAAGQPSPPTPPGRTMGSVMLGSVPASLRRGPRIIGAMLGSKT
jgi:Protein of unknown function (DUF2628)